MCNENGRLSLPVIGQLQGEASEIADQAVYAFSVDESPMFLIPGKAMADRIPEGSPEEWNTSIYVNCMTGMRDGRRLQQLLPDIWITGMENIGTAAAAEVLWSIPIRNVR